MKLEKDGESKSEKNELSRRDVLKTTWSLLSGAAMLEFGGLTLAYMQPRSVEGEFGSVITVGEVDDFPPGSVTYISNGRFYLSRLPDGGFLALYQRCTHLGCAVPWSQEQNAFICPCHSSQFSQDGAVLNPPAPRPLDLFAVTIETGEVLVDTGNPISRQQFDSSQVVYL